MYIVVSPVNGICNRLRVLFSYYLLAKESRAKYFVYWDYSDDFDKTTFDEMFEHKNAFNFINKKTWDLMYKSTKKIHQELPFEVFADGTRKQNNPNGFNLLPIECDVSYIGSEDYACLLKEKPDKYTQKMSLMYRRLRPSNLVQNQIDIFLKTLENGLENVIGVHIRRGDAIQTIWRDVYLQSSDDKFVKRMKQILKKRAVRFLLSTDCEETLLHFRRLFGDLIIYYPKQFSESRSGTEKNGQIDAATELFLLSKTEYILGNNWSTFSYTAAKIGRKTLKVIR